MRSGPRPATVASRRLAQEGAVQRWGRGLAAVFGGFAVAMLVVVYGPPQPRGDQFFLWLLAIIAIGWAAGGMVYSFLQGFKARR
jgi:hypothetical protein